MSKRWIIKWAALSGVGAFAFFEVELPTTWSAVVELITDLDELIINTPASPFLFVVALGVILGVGVVPDVWWVIKRFLPYKTRSNWPIYDAISHIINNSAWAHYNRATAAKRGSGMKLLPAVTEIRQKGLHGDIQIWGKPTTGGTKENPTFFDPVESLIWKDYWRKFEIDWETAFSKDGRNKAQTKPFDPNDQSLENIVRFSNLRVNHRQFLEQPDWKKASLFARMRTWHFERKSDGVTG